MTGGPSGVVSGHTMNGPVALVCNVDTRSSGRGRMIAVVEIAKPGTRRVTVEQVAEEALHVALRGLCGPSSWRGVARGVAWEIVSTGRRSRHSLELLADTAEAMFAALIDEALWTVERTVLETWDEFLVAHPGDERGGLGGRLSRCGRAEPAARPVRP